MWSWVSAHLWFKTWTIASTQKQNKNQLNIFFGDHRQAFTQTIHSNANHDPTIEQLLSKISTMHDHPMDVCFFSFKEFKHIWDLSSLLSNHEKQSLEYMGMILTTFQIIWPNWRYRFNKNKQKNYKNNHIILQLLPNFCITLLLNDICFFLFVVLREKKTSSLLKWDISWICKAVQR